MTKNHKINRTLQGEECPAPLWARGIPILREHGMFVFFWLFEDRWAEASRDRFNWRMTKLPTSSSQEFLGSLGSAFGGDFCCPATEDVAYSPEPRSRLTQQ